MATNGNGASSALGNGSASRYSLFSFLFFFVISSCYCDMINEYGLVVTFVLANILIMYVVMIYLFLWIKIYRKLLISFTNQTSNKVNLRYYV